MLVVDTNVLVHAADEDSPFHPACRSWLDAQRAKPEAWFLTWPIVYEFLRVTTHPRVLRNAWSTPAAWEFVQALLACPGLDVLAATERHADVAAQVFAEHPHIAGNLVHDAHTVILMREHGIRRIVTRDTDFHRFKSIEPVDPVA